MRVKRGDIVYISEKAKVYLGDSIQDLNRPFVVISNNTNNKKCPTVNITAVTSNMDKVKYPMHVYISKHKYNLKDDSVALCEQILTINNKLIVNKKCSLDNKDLEKLNKALFVQVISEHYDFEMFEGEKHNECKNTKPHKESRRDNSNSCKTVLQPA